LNDGHDQEQFQEGMTDHHQGTCPKATMDRLSHRGSQYGAGCHNSREGKNEGPSKYGRQFNHDLRLMDPGFLHFAHENQFFQPGRKMRKA
jgi:hypothetical protein